MLTLFTFLVGGPFFLTAGLLYVIQYSGNPLRGERMSIITHGSLCTQNAPYPHLQFYVNRVNFLTGIFIPTKKADATSWSWWVNFFNWVRAESLYRPYKHAPALLSFGGRLCGKRSCLRSSEWTMLCSGAASGSP